MTHSRLPRVLIVGSTDIDAADLTFLSKGFLLIEAEKSPILAVNRLGLEDWDMVVVDPDADEMTVVQSVVDSLKKMNVPFVVLRQGENGNLKQMSDSGRFKIKSCSKREFVDSVLDLVGQPA